MNTVLPLIYIVSVHADREKTAALIRHLQVVGKGRVRHFSRLIDMPAGVEVAKVHAKNLGEAAVVAVFASPTSLVELDLEEVMRSAKEVFPVVVGTCFWRMTPLGAVGPRASDVPVKTDEEWMMIADRLVTMATAGAP